LESAKRSADQIVTKRPDGLRKTKEGCSSKPGAQGKTEILQKAGDDQENSIEVDLRRTCAAGEEWRMFLILRALYFRYNLNDKNLWEYKFLHDTVDNPSPRLRVEAACGQAVASQMRGEELRTRWSGRRLLWESDLIFTLIDELVMKYEFIPEQ